MSGYTGATDGPVGIVHPAERYVSAPKGSTEEQVREIAERMGLTEDQVIDMAHAMMAMQKAEKHSITYTNRAARRARASAERKKS